MKKSGMASSWIKMAALAALLAFGVLPAAAQRIAYVDVNKILENVPEYVTAQSELDGLAARWRQEIAQEYDKIKGMYNRYQAEQVLLSNEARQKKGRRNHGHGKRCARYTTRQVRPGRHPFSTPTGTCTPHSG